MNNIYINVRDYEQKINSLENQNKIKDEAMGNSEREKASLRQEISNLKIKNNTLQRRLADLEGQKKKLEKECEEKVINFEDLEKKNKVEIDNLKKEKNVLELAVNRDLDTIEKLKKFGVEVKYQGNDNPIEIKPETQEIVGKNYDFNVDLKIFMI